jgi:hypothetical protein
MIEMQAFESFRCVTVLNSKEHHTGKNERASPRSPKGFTANSPG